MTSHYDQGRLDNKSDFIMLPLSYSSSLHFSLSLSLSFFRVIIILMVISFNVTWMFIDWFPCAIRQ